MASVACLESTINAAFWMVQAMSWMMSSIKGAKYVVETVGGATWEIMGLTQQLKAVEEGVAKIAAEAAKKAKEAARREKELEGTVVSLNRQLEAERDAWRGKEAGYKSELELTSAKTEKAAEEFKSSADNSSSNLDFL